ncbi:FkbM family methyltransferase [Asticcacaulis sp. W401b]|uniref:FkbM family methyltransferase n=1 Tax=Asticcacaulis sp. W401b TaxID=3388666 RepID=UPI0039707746
MLPKAAGNDFLGRFREIISDPLNLLIPRHPKAGAVEGDLVYLHNGHCVPLRGEGAYYGDFSDIFVINRGVHEPVEEYVFQQVMERLPDAPVMLELGAYWAHYSMWMKQCRPNSTAYLVEPDKAHLEAGKANFHRHHYEGEFIQAFVGSGAFGIDDFLSERNISHLNILHSDIQGCEVEMLKDSNKSLASHAIDFLLISTHSQQIHKDVVETMYYHGYRVEVSCDFEGETTSFDGFVFATSPLIPRLFNNFTPMTRVDICHASPKNLIDFVVRAIAE